MKKSKITIEEQIQVLEDAKKRLQLEIYTCLAIKQTIYEKYRFLTSFEVTDFIPLHNRKHANKLCKLNNIEITNTNYRKSKLNGWWFFEVNDETTNWNDMDRSKMIAVRKKYLDALINELKKML